MSSYMLKMQGNCSTKLFYDDFGVKQLVISLMSR